MGLSRLTFRERGVRIKSKLNIVLMAFLTAAAVAFTACRPTQSPNDSKPGNDNVGDAQPDELKRLDQLSTNLNLNFGANAKRVGERNGVGIKSDNLLFSQRRDSRTYFVEDNRYGEGKEYGIFQGSDAEVLEKGRSILQQLNIPADEIAEAAVFTEKTQTGQVDQGTGKVVPGPVRDGKKSANFSRQIKNIPVFSSHAQIGLTNQRGIGFLEVHWPEISSQVIDEAQKLQETVKGGWRPPEQKGAHVEKVEAGIIHSPALGFVMDVYPAIRVIYSVDDNESGKKMTLYLDGSGRSVAVPRQFEKLEETPAPPRPSPKPNQ
jgi:hypothetical protein